MSPLRSLISLLVAISPFCYAAEYTISTESDLIGEVITIEALEEDSFIKLAQQYSISVRELQTANPNIDPWYPGAGQHIIIPGQHLLPNKAQRKGIVVNLAELRLYYFPENSNKVYTFPIGAGKPNWQTPVTKTRIIKKDKDPVWRVPASIRSASIERGSALPRVVPAGPNNPLGLFALRLGVPGYLIHGTNNPAGVGRRASHGCIRMYPKDIEQLFSLVPLNTPVNIIHEQVKVGKSGDQILIEANEAHAEYLVSIEESLERVMQQLEVIGVTLSQLQSIDWSIIKPAIQYPSAIPFTVSN